MISDLKKAIDAFQAFHNARQSYPRNITGQQLHFSAVLPMLEREAVEALRYFLGNNELETLRDLIDVLLDDDRSLHCDCVDECIGHYRGE